MRSRKRSSVTREATEVGQDGARALGTRARGPRGAVVDPRDHCTGTRHAGPSPTRTCSLRPL